MIQIRESDVTGWAQGDSIPIYSWNQNRVFAFTRNNGKYLIIFNFGGTSFDNYGLNGLSGTYKELANTSWPAYRLDINAPEKTIGSNYVSVSSFAIPAFGAVVLQKQ